MYTVVPNAMPKSVIVTAEKYFIVLALVNTLTLNGVAYVVNKMNSNRDENIKICW